MEQTYGCPVTAVLPHSDDILVFGSAGLFTLHHPDHPITESLARTAAQILG
jgi:hypothetical protein